MSVPRWKVLVADDNPMFCGLAEMLLQQDGYEVVTAETVDDARERLRDHRLDLAVLDLNLVQQDPHDMSGLLLAIEEAPEVPKIVITGHGRIEIERYFTRLNASRIPQDRHPQVLFKPVAERDPELLELRAAVHEKLVPRVF
ncbi:MAG TPA: response regulator, partial [Longimicrobium sp.]